MQTGTETKRRKRGDVRDDGMVFWTYHPECGDGEWWLTPEQFATNREKLAAYRAANREKFTARDAAYRAANREKIAAYKAAHWAANREKILAYRSSPAYRDICNTYHRKCIQNNPLFALRQRLRGRISKAFTRIGKSKPALAEDLLGCSWEKAKAHIEKQFAPGMSWERRAEFEIDHVIPIASAYDEYTTIMLCHYTNLKPIWAHENEAKGATWHPPEYSI